MKVAAKNRGLYAIPPMRLVGDALLRAVSEALAGGAVWIQYRAKHGADAATASALAGLCRSAGARLIVNDDPELAARSGADGVHLGREDVSLAEAREIVGRERLIGVSCYNDLERAAVLAAQGADYLAFGSLFASPTKPGAVRCAPETLTAARRFGLPLVAIGGITLSTLPTAIAAGADLVAVISDLFDAPDVRVRARAYRERFADAADHDF